MRQRMSLARNQRVGLGWRSVEPIASQTEEGTAKAEYVHAHSLSWPLALLYAVMAGPAGLLYFSTRVGLIGTMLTGALAVFDVRLVLAAWLASILLAPTVVSVNNQRVRRRADLLFGGRK